MSLFPLLLVHLLKYLCGGTDAKVCSGGHHLVSVGQGPHQLTATMKAALPQTQLVQAGQLLPQLHCSQSLQTALALHLQLMLQDTPVLPITLE